MFCTHHLALPVVGFEYLTGFFEVIQRRVVLYTAVGIQQQGHIDPGLGQLNSEVLFKRMNR